jgi:hypothetical protein
MLTSYLQVVVFYYKSHLIGTQEALKTGNMTDPNEHNNSLATDHKEENIEKTSD